MGRTTCSSQLISSTTTTTSTATVAKMASASVLLHTTQLEELEKDELIALVMELQNEKNALVGQLEVNEVKDSLDPIPLRSRTTMQLKKRELFNCSMELRSR